MVFLSKIYTKTGDDGTTGLGDGTRVKKTALRIEAYGTVDETGAAVGLAAAHTSDATLLARLRRIQNDLFDVGADLCVPEGDGAAAALRVTPAQVARLEREIDEVNADLEPLRSFVLSGGDVLSSHLHLARTVARRAERRAVALAEVEAVNAAVIHYLNRLSDYLFVLARAVNVAHGTEVLWTPGENR